MWILEPGRGTPSVWRNFRLILKLNAGDGIRTRTSLFLIRGASPDSKSGESTYSATRAQFRRDAIPVIFGRLGMYNSSHSFSLSINIRLSSVVV